MINRIELPAISFTSFRIGILLFSFCVSSVYAFISIMHEVQNVTEKVLSDFPNYSKSPWFYKTTDFQTVKKVFLTV